MFSCILKTWMLVQPEGKPSVLAVSVPVLAVSVPVLAVSVPVLAVSAPVLAVSVPVLAVSAPVLAFSVPVLAVSVPVLAFSVPVLAVSVPASAYWRKPQEKALNPVRSGGSGLCGGRLLEYPGNRGPGRPHRYPSDRTRIPYIQLKRLPPSHLGELRAAQGPR